MEYDLLWEKLDKVMNACYGGRRLENPFEEIFTLFQIGIRIVCGGFKTFVFTSRMNSEE